MPIVAATLLLTRFALANDPAVPDFKALVTRAEKAQQSNDPLEAAKAYRDALKLQFDPTIAGRLGLVLMGMQQFDIAAHHLHSAVESPSANISDAEYGKFVRAYKHVLREVCRVEVTIDHLGARLEVDGQLQQEGKGEYWFFAMPGMRKLHVTLDGFADERKTVNAERGTIIEVKFSMRLLTRPEPPEPRKQPMPIPTNKPISTTKSTSSARVVTGAGFALVFNATPAPAVGPHIFVAWSSRSWWEIGAELRVGWTIVEDKRFPDTQFVAWSAAAAPCGRWRNRLFGCGLLQLDGVARDDASDASLLPGFGLRGGIEFAATKHLRLQGWGDAVFHHRGFRVRDQTPWDGWPVIFTFGIRGAYKL